MKIRKFIYCLLAYCISVISNSKAQDHHFPVIAMELQTKAIRENVTNGQPDLSDSTIFNIMMKIAISDTISPTNLLVTLKRSVDDQTTVFTKSFVYDVSGTFSDSTSYSRNGYEITLNLGNHMGTITPYAELIMQNISQPATDPIIYY